MYACMCANYMREAGNGAVREYVLVGNKRDVVEKEPGKRRVDGDMAGQWAQSQGMRHVEVTANERGDVEAVVHVLLRDVVRAQEREGERRGTTVRSRIKKVFKKLKS